MAGRMIADRMKERVSLPLRCSLPRNPSH